MSRSIYKSLKSLKILSSLGIALFLSCSMFTDMGGNTQSIERLTASPFIAELNGSTTKTISLSVENGSHIAWIGFDQSGDYNYFKVDQVTTGSRTIENESGSSVEVFENISVSSTNSSSLLLTLTYKAKAAMESEDDPFSASLLIVFDYPETKTIQIQLNGYVQGICDDCRLSPDHGYVYQAIDSDDNGQLDFELFVCDEQAVPQAPAEYRKEGALPDDNGTEVEEYVYSLVEWDEDEAPLFYLYTSDKKTDSIVIDAGEEERLSPSIPPFEIPLVVDIGIDIPGLPVEMEEGFQAICPLDSSTNQFLCSGDDSGIMISVFGGQLTVEPLTVTNGTIDLTTATVGGLQSSGCANFGTWSGSGELGQTNETEEDLKIIAVGIVSEAQSTTVSSLNTGIEGALILAVIPLEFVELIDL